MTGASMIDSAPSHRARQTQTWLQANVPNWITPQQWPPYSPDENGLDYSIWRYLEAKACEKSHNSQGIVPKCLFSNCDLKNNFYMKIIGVGP